MVYVVFMWDKFSDHVYCNRVYQNEEEAKTYCEKMNKQYASSSDPFSREIQFYYETAGLF